VLPPLINRWLPVAIAVVSCACETTRSVAPPQLDLSREAEFRLRVECAVQGEKLVAETERDAELEKRRIGTDDAVFDSQNHYNKKLNRCFVLITTRDRQSLNLRTVVLDAFEHSRLLVCNGGGTHASSACLGENTHTTPTWLSGLTPAEVPVPEALGRIADYLSN